jgi:hypothetical protein
MARPLEQRLTRRTTTSSVSPVRRDRVEIQVSPRLRPVPAATACLDCSGSKLSIRFQGGCPTGFVRHENYKCGYIMISVCYIDAAVRDNAGHHANACRHFVGEFRRRGSVVYPFGNRDLDSTIGRELNIEPLFRHYPYSRLRGGPYVSYLIERSSFLLDLRFAWRARTV